MTIDLNGHQVTFPTFVADIPDDCLLGADFLRLFGRLINMQTNEMHFTLPDGSNTTMHSCGETPAHSCRLVRTIRITEPIRIDDFEEIVLSATICPGRSDNREYQVNPISSQNHNQVSARSKQVSPSTNLLVARSVTSGLDDEVLVTVQNPSERTSDLPLGTAVAECVVIPHYAQDSESKSMESELHSAAISQSLHMPSARATFQPPTDSVTQCQAQSQIPQTELGTTRTGPGFSLGAVGTANITVATQINPANSEENELPEALKPFLSNTPAETERQHRRLKQILHRKAGAFSLNGELGFMRPFVMILILATLHPSNYHLDACLDSLKVSLTRA